jgi:hypothetical protein
MISKEQKAKREQECLADLAKKLDLKNSSDSQEALVWTEVECILNQKDDLYYDDGVNPSQKALKKTIEAMDSLIYFARIARTTMRRLVP